MYFILSGYHGVVQSVVASENSKSLNCEVNVTNMVPRIPRSAHTCACYSTFYFPFGLSILMSPLRHPLRCANKLTLCPKLKMSFLNLSIHILKQFPNFPFGRRAWEVVCFGVKIFLSKKADLFILNKPVVSIFKASPGHLPAEGLERVRWEAVACGKGSEKSLLEKKKSQPLNTSNWNPAASISCI